jgi:hypothetical protein
MEIHHLATLGDVCPLSSQGQLIQIPLFKSHSWTFHWTFHFIRADNGALLSSRQIT